MSKFAMGTCRCFVREVRGQQADFLPRLPLVSTRETDFNTDRAKLSVAGDAPGSSAAADQQRNTTSVLANQIKS